ncbi:FAD-dependent oxidoreductase [Candidatus Pseudothioglobus singularis]|nr:FAD-dependent oxidoreductase [Candidatus Pseudothioglobus singularis]MDC0492416.1 FAD-dependent oxidoreductase [Candidatus Pseudothioglobus singularis]MDC0648343.1 FAD-dependent oxidoreductase [Candidatus Pseudothioglobus singularis]MDC1541378.1 FAD-dependent oxidoreductase [Candidatus Pseudothioglobus singularis]
MKDQARVVVIGGGVVGCSILFHLAKMGWKDAILLERNELTSGSSWHAAGQIHTISSDPNISRLQDYTINLYKEIEETSGHSVGMHSTGGYYLASNQSWHDYLKRERSKARSMGLEQEFVSLDEVVEKHPLINPENYVAALWDPLDGDIDPSGVTYAYAKSARVHGAEFYTHTPVIETNQRPDGSWDVVTEKGNIHAEHIVNAGGLWARELGRMSGIHLPVVPMEHHYLITEEIDKITSLPEGQRLPACIDYEANIYFRQERSGLLLGTYEPQSTPWSLDGTPQTFGHDLLEPDLDRIADRLALAFERIPSLQNAGIKDTINGPFVFSPDGNPMIGPVPGMKNYWTAVGVMAGFCQAGGVGKTLAEWMIEGEPSIDVWAMDIARFGDFATPEWGVIKSSENYERRFVMTFPNETLPKGRRQKTTSIYDRLTQKGAVWQDSFGLENVLWFASSPEDAYEEPTFHRSRSHEYVAKEVEAVRASVGASEVANFANHKFTGKGAKAFLNKVLAGRIPSPGRVNLTPMLLESGKLNGDLTVACIDDETYYLFGSSVAQNMHLRWFEMHLEGVQDVVYQNMTDDFHGIAISGPNSRELLSRLTREDVSSDGFKFRDIRDTFVGGVPALCVRISFTGELGYEIYVAPQYQLKLFEAIEEVGEDLDLKWFGGRALMSMRLEKSWGAWTMDFRPDFTIMESGLDFFVDWDKDFIGKKAALIEKMKGPTKKLSVIQIETETDVSGDEAVMHNGECVSYITSGGYGHSVQRSLAMTYLPVELIDSNTTLEVEILGEFHKASIVMEPLYDPSGSKMR